jgi:hypothetical protein
MTQSYLRDRRLAEALGCQVSPSEVGTTLLRQARREQALGKAVYEVTPEAVHEFIELHRHVLLHEADYVLDLAVFPWGNETPAATLDRSRMVMDALAGGEASPEDLRAAGAELFLGVTMSETQAMHYDPDLAAALRSMPLGVYSLPASSNRAGGFLMVKLTERDSDRPLDPEEEADRKMIARIYLQSQGDQAVERVLEKLKLQTSARCEEIEKLIGTTEEAMP